MSGSYSAKETIVNKRKSAEFIKAQMIVQTLMLVDGRSEVLIMSKEDKAFQKKTRNRIRALRIELRKHPDVISNSDDTKRDMQIERAANNELRFDYREVRILSTQEFNMLYSVKSQTHRSAKTGKELEFYCQCTVPSLSLSNDRVLVDVWVCAETNECFFVHEAWMF